MPDFYAATPDQLAAVLRGLRTQTGLTQKQAGNKVGLLPKTISALEADPRRSTITSLYKLLSALEVEIILKPKPQAATSHDDPDW
ncbi:MAG: helix-turn-helix domain-containing protein [Alcaligenaceae bacterium]|nr:helix-turn-helix domain-containing protein [Alcaligenaceae bacterium]